MLQEKPCKHPIQPMKKLKCKAFLHLVFSPPSPRPLRKRLKYLKQFTGICTKGWDSFFFFFFSFCYNMKRKNRQDEHKCIFTFKKNCRPPSGSKYDPKQNKFNKKINADLWGVKQAVRWDGMLERLHIYDKEALTASITFFFFFFP